jgi:hypothetical protein
MASFATISATSSSGASPSLCKDFAGRAYPPVLRDKIDFAILRLDGRIKSVHTAETGPINRPPSSADRHKFTLWRGTGSSPHNQLPGVYAHREAADLELMKTWAAAFGQVQHWPELDTASTANPAGFEQQFVGRGEVGWALDQHGCLALAQLSREGDEIEWLYVRAEVADGQVPLPPGNVLPIDPLPAANTSGFKPFALTPKTRR